MQAHVTKINGFVVWLSGLILIGVGLGSASFLPPIKAEAALQIGKQSLRVELAETPIEQARGLAGRWCRLRDDQGMLFTYNSLRQPTFWMKGMRWPIDIVWIADGRVVGWEANVPTDSGFATYPAPIPIDLVLEVAAGWTQRQGLKVGTPVMIERSLET